MIFFSLHSTNSCPPLGGGHSRTVPLPHRLPQGPGLTSVLPAGRFPKTCSPASGLSSQSLTICWPLSTPCLESFFIFYINLFYLISSVSATAPGLDAVLSGSGTSVTLFFFSFPHLSLIPRVSVCSTCWGPSCPTRKKKLLFFFFSSKWPMNFIDTQTNGFNWKALWLDGFLKKYKRISIN